MNLRIFALAGVVVLVYVTGITRAQPPAGEWFTLSKIGPNVWAAIDNPKAQQRSYANAGFVIGDEGVVVIDTLTGEEAGRQLLQQIRTLTTLPVTFVVNTHYHAITWLETRCSPTSARVSSPIETYARGFIRRT
jgi:cyclase